MAIQIKTEIFDPFEEIQAYQKKKFTDIKSIGASTIFIGTMRDFNEGAPIKSITLDYSLIYFFKVLQI